MLVIAAGQQVPPIDRDDFETYLVAAEDAELRLFDAGDVAEYLEKRGVLDLDPQTIFDRVRGRPRELGEVVDKALLGL